MDTTPIRPAAAGRRMRLAPTAPGARCVLCGASDPRALFTTRCPDSDEPVTTCLDSLGCLERHRREEPARYIATLLAAVRGGRTRLAASQRPSLKSRVPAHTEGR